MRIKVGGFRRKRQGGQAVVETALTFMLLIFLLIGWLGEAVQIVARVEVENALYLATVSASQAPRGYPQWANSYAQTSYNETIDQNPLLSGGNITCGGSYMSNSYGGLGATELWCTISGVKLLYTKTPLGVVYRSDLTLVSSETATVYPSQFRTCSGADNGC